MVVLARACVLVVVPVRFLQGGAHTRAGPAHTWLLYLNLAAISGCVLGLPLVGLSGARDQMVNSWQGQSPAHYLAVI